MTAKRTSPTANADYSVINLCTAIWALRFVLSNPNSSLWARDADDFLKLVGEHLTWTNASLETLLDETALEEGERDEVREIGFQQAWLRFRDDYNHPHERSIINAFRRLARSEKGLIHRVIKSSLTHLEKQIAKTRDPMTANSRMLQKILGLSDADCAVLDFSAQMMQSQYLRAFAHLVPVRSFDEAVHSLAIMLDVEQQEAANALKSSGLLVEYGLIEICRAPSDLEALLTVPDNVQACLTEQHGCLEEMMLHFVRPAKTTCLTNEDYPHLAHDHLALSRFFHGSREQRAKGVNIMFYGEPGTGKTEFAKVLARESGFNLYEVASANKFGESLNRAERLASLRISLRFLADNKNALLLFDEIEDIFPNPDDVNLERLTRNKSNYYGKAWMNHTLETNPVPVIWVSNTISQIDPAYLRRFSYHMEVRKPPFRVRHRIAEKYLHTTSVSRDFIQQVAQKSALTPALIESAARVVSLSKVDDSQEAERLVSRVIHQCQTAMGLNDSSDLRSSPTAYHLDYLNLDSRHSIDQIAKSLRLNPTATLCFYGLPGTGKTALAEYLAEELDRPLLAKRASDILSKWLGGSEKNIAKMFREAEHEGAILFLDEADSLLRDREGASRSWEVSQVNELLQQIERFSGIFICATNLFGNLDAAALRRFTFKIAFRAMTPEQREKMFVKEALQGDALQLEDAARRRLQRLDSLVPGDFAVVKRQSRMLGVLPAPEAFLAELEAECKMKSDKQSRAIGFMA